MTTLFQLSSASSGSRSLELSGGAGASYGISLIRLVGGGATGLLGAEVVDEAVMSSTPPIRFMPWRKTVKPSPPSARKLFVATR